MLKNVKIIVEPRFPGGTSFAAAQEIQVLSKICDLSVSYIRTQMFPNHQPNQSLAKACSAAGVKEMNHEQIIQAETLILHNPSCFKFDKEPSVRFVCDRLFVVCHENFLLPNGAQGFDVEHCLALLEKMTLSRKLYLCPISTWNRKTVLAWLQKQDNIQIWEVLEPDWFNICLFDYHPPTLTPADRRGRHSRPGPEKFPSRAVLEEIFPETAESVRILGANSLMQETSLPSNWTLLPFGSEDVEIFLKSIDFLVYYTNPHWRESYGRVLAEGIAAGKVVISDPETASNFGGGVIPAESKEVNDLIKGFVAKPKTYVDFVRKAQKSLRRFSDESFERSIGTILTQSSRHETVEKKLNDLLR